MVALQNADILLLNRSWRTELVRNCQEMIYIFEHSILVRKEMLPSEGLHTG